MPPSQSSPDEPTITAALAWYIRRRRVGAEQTAQDIYEVARLEKSVYDRLEANVRGFSAEQIRAIARAHGMKGWELFKEAEEALEKGEVPEQLPSVHAWRRMLGFDS